ncbi:hypothetical protein [Xinfangfangia pollutisoli]|uniref:hypothetical protein n=1 Tax=Xinfangfangia pollutisoli TaxID=2865960 RepID=UPI001CD722CB|nr:hypothetical protein [Xinfangfangia pollutisoli]
MPLLLLLLLIGVLAYQWHVRRTSTLTRACRWRLDRGVAPDYWRCAACGAEQRGPEPRDCLRPGR